MIRLGGVSKSWDGGQTYAINRLNLEVGCGEVVALLGGSGCGKSTTVKMINRLIEPTDGTIMVDGNDVRSLDPVQLRRRIGYVFQAIGLFPHMTVGDNISIVLRLQGQKDNGARVHELLELVELPAAEFRDRYPRQLSGGQQQRVGFARALAARPRVMLLDEPFGALDPVTRDSLQIEFQRLQRQLQLTALLVTHDMAEALLLADRIAIMRAGKILRIGTPAELLQEPGDEYVAALLQTPRRHGELIQRLQQQCDHPGDDA